MDNDENTQKYYKEFGKQKIEIVLDDKGLHYIGPKSIAAPMMISYYLGDYFSNKNLTELEKFSMIGGLKTVLSGFKEVE